MISRKTKRTFAALASVSAVFIIAACDPKAPQQAQAPSKDQLLASCKMATLQQSGEEVETIHLYPSAGGNFFNACMASHNYRLVQSPQCFNPSSDYIAGTADLGPEIEDCYQPVTD